MFISTESSVLVIRIVMHRENQLKIATVYSEHTYMF